MTGFVCRIAWRAAVVALLTAGSANAQENLDSGKTPAQLYASDCAICHKTPQGLSKSVGDFGLASFLREHYTASREAAAAIAAYVQANDHGGPPAERGAKRTGKPKEAAKQGQAKPKGEGKGEGKDEAKSSEPAKPAETKPAETKPGDKPVEAKAEGGKADAKPPAEVKPDSKKPESEKKSD